MKAELLLKGRNRDTTTRLEGFDYGSNGAYFVTICSYKKNKTFSEVINGETCLFNLGKMIHAEIEKTCELRNYVTISDWVIMPNHIHCIIFIHKGSDDPEHLRPHGSNLHFPDGYRNKFGAQRENLGSIIRGIKSTVTIQARIAGIRFPIWQQRFHEHIIRNQIELEKYVLYIKENPYRWEMYKPAD